LKYSRGKQEIENNFVGTVIISVLAMIEGVIGWDEIELYASSHKEWRSPFCRRRGVTMKGLKAGLA
jgi:hypothetical protein